MGAGGRVCEEPRSRQRAGSRTTRVLCESRAASWETAPAPGPPPPRGLRLLPSHTPRAARAPGFPGAPPPSLHTRLPTQVLLPPAGLVPSRASPRSQAPLTHTRRRGRPLLSALLLVVLANAAVGGGLMSLQHHAAAAEEGEGAAGGFGGFGRMRPRNAAGATAAPPPPFLNRP